VILDEILSHTREQLSAVKRRVSPEELRHAAEAVSDPARGFRRALETADEVAVIAELKRRSPSRGEIRPGFDPVDCARAYQAGGAAALSVLTEERFFGGQLEFLGAVRKAVGLPLLRKDFVVDPYQIDEARVHGADAVLLIVAALAPDALEALRARADALGLDTLVEVHDEAELRVALDLGADLIGINNRDLRTFETDLATTERLAPGVPGDVLLISESGICSPPDLARVARAGARAVLVGESLMREVDVAAALRQLRGVGAAGGGRSRGTG
jgi:indole-3-glycerol phosphate synthase